MDTYVPIDLLSYTDEAGLMGLWLLVYWAYGYLSHLRHLSWSSGSSDPSDPITPISIHNDDDLLWSSGSNGYNRGL